MSQFSEGWSTPPRSGAPAGAPPVVGGGPAGAGGAPACQVIDYPGLGDAPDGKIIQWRCWTGHPAPGEPPGDKKVVMAYVQFPTGSAGNPAAGYEWLFTHGGTITRTFDVARKDEAIAFCCGGSQTPAGPPPPVQTPVQPGPPAPPGQAPPGAACPAPCPPAPVIVPDQGAAAPGQAAPADLASCLPGWGQQIAAMLAGKSLRDLLIGWGYMDADGRQVWAKKWLEWCQKQDGVLQQAACLVGWAADFVSSLTIQGVSSASETIEGAIGCPKGAAAVAIALRGLTGIWERWVGHVPEAMGRAIYYTQNWACPTELPSQAEINSAYQARTVTVDQWRCVTQANGLDPIWQARVLRGEEDVPGPERLIMLERLGESVPADLVRAWHRNGVHHKWSKQLHEDAAQFIPTPSDAVEWMGKDLSDPLLTQTFGLYNEFRQKFRGDVAEAFRLNAMDEKWARLIFASHRKGAAPHQMYEMHKRLRPGWWANLPDLDALHMAQAIAPRRPQGEGGLLEQASNLEFLGQQKSANALYGGDPAATARFGGTVWVKAVVSPDPGIVVPADLTGLPPQWLDEIGESVEAARAYLAETVTSGFHVFEGLSQANYPPFWRARLLALSYNVMTRVDMRRAYETGQLSKEQLFQKLQDRGYTPVDSGYLAGFYEQAATQLASRRPAVGAWVQDGYDISLLQQALIDQGMREEMWPAVKRIAETRRQILIQQKCIRHLKKLVIAGLVEEKAIHPRLVAIGLTDPEADRLRSEWACEMRSIPKAESAAQVCKYLKENLIGPEQAAKLIHRLGYTWKEARRMVGSCLLEPVRRGTKTREALPGAIAAAKIAAPADDDESGITPEDRATLAQLQAALAGASNVTRPALQLALDQAKAAVAARPEVQQMVLPPPNGE